MEKQTAFPDLLVEMMHAGETTGKVDEMMDCIADFYDDEVEAVLEGLTALLEPLLMVFLGLIIGGIVVCMFAMAWVRARSSGVEITIPEMLMMRLRGLKPEAIDETILFLGTHLDHR